MATYRATEAALSYPMFVPAYGEPVTIGVTYEIATAIAAGDNILLCKLPKGAKIVDLRMWADDLDGGTTLVVDVGTTYDDDLFLGNSTAFRSASNLVHTNFFPDGLLSALTQDTYLQFNVDTGPNSGGTGTLSAIVSYYMTPTVSD